MKEIQGCSSPIYTLSSLNLTAQLLVGTFASGDIEFSGLIDTGATTTFVPENGTILSNIKPLIEPTNVKLQTGDNNAFTVLSRTTLKLKPDYANMDPVSVKVLVVNNRSDLVGHAIVIGVSEIKSFGLSIGIEEGKLTAWKNGSVVASEERATLTTNVLNTATA